MDNYFQVDDLKLQKDEEKEESKDENKPDPAAGGDSEENVTPGELSMLRKVMRKGIIQSKNKVEVLRADPKNPLHSVKSFEALDLRKELLKGIYEMGFRLPSKIQEISLPTLLAEPYVPNLYCIEKKYSVEL